MLKGVETLRNREFHLEVIVRAFAALSRSSFPLPVRSEPISIAFENAACSVEPVMFLQVLLKIVVCWV